MPLTFSQQVEITQERKLGRNEPCHCGSGKKYKKCCLHKDQGYTPSAKAGYISTVEDWLTKQAWFKTILEKQLSTFFPPGSTVEEENLTAVLECLMFESRYKGVTSLQHFVKSDQLSETDRAYYQSWVDKTVFSIFDVQKTQLGKSIELKDIFDDQLYFVYEKLATYTAQPGMLIVGRLVPFQDQWMFTGGFSRALPAEAKYSLKRASALNKSRPTQLEYMSAIYPVKPDTPPPGHLEKALVDQLMREAMRAYEDLPVAEANKHYHGFIKRWLQTPQPELAGQSPTEAILAERRKLGNPNTEIGYALTTSPIDPNEENSMAYNQTIKLMKQSKYFQALQQLARLIPALASHPEPYRWYNNIGLCLIQLGAIDLGKKYFDKALALRPDYEQAQDNLRNFADPVIIEDMRSSGSASLLSALARQKLNVADFALDSNQLVHDARQFFNYLTLNKVQLTHKTRQIIFAQVKTINQLFTHPDEAEHKHTLREEWQMPKVNFLCSVGICAGLIKDAGKYLQLTAKGKEFVKYSPSQQLLLLLQTWLFDLNWADLGTPHTLIGDLIGDFNAAMQPVAMLIVMKLDAAGKILSKKDLLKRRTSTDATAAKFAGLIEDAVLDRTIIRYLTWAGLLETLTKRTLLHFTKMKNDTFAVTKTGAAVTKILQTQLEEGIPPAIRELL